MTFIPYIFSHEQINNLFRTCDTMCTPLKIMRYKLFAIPALLRLLYGTGLRVGEAIALKISDIDLKNGLILISQSKNNQQRIVPVNQSLKEVLIQYYNERKRLPLLEKNNKDDYFFISPSGIRLKGDDVYNWFKKALKLCDIPHIGRYKGPRVHDLRHTFAVHSLKAQVDAGVDIYCALPILSVFLGHKNLKGTEQYVRLTQEMFPDVIQMEDKISSYIFPTSINLTQNEE